MKDLKTTLVGLFAGLPVVFNALANAYQAGTFTGETGYHLAAGIGIVLLGALASDSKKTVSE